MGVPSAATHVGWRIPRLRDERSLDTAMGRMTYAGTEVEFDDRTLTHLQIAIVHKFRAGEPFLMSWLDPQSIGNGRSSMWLTPSSPVHFKFAGSRVPALDRTWVEALIAAASSGSGLIVCDERGELVRATDHVRPRR